MPDNPQTYYMQISHVRAQKQNLKGPLCLQRPTIDLYGFLRLWCECTTHLLKEVYLFMGSFWSMAALRVSTQQTLYVPIPQRLSD